MSSRTCTHLIRTFHFNCSPHCTAHRFSRWKTRMIFLTVQSQIQRLQADLLHGIARTSGLDGTPLGEGADYLIRTFHFNCSQQSTSSSILCCVSVGNVNHVQKKGDVWGEAKNCLLRLVPRVLPALRHRWRAGRGSSGAFTHDTQWFNFSPKHKRSAKARTYIWSSSKDRSSSCRCATTSIWTRRTTVIFPLQITKWCLILQQNFRKDWSYRPLCSWLPRLLCAFATAAHGAYHLGAPGAGLWCLSAHCT